MEINKKAEIITQFVSEFGGNEEHENFFEYNDLGIPLCVSLKNDLIEKLSKDGIGVIEETWGMLCEEIGVDPSLDYEELEDMIGE